MDFSVSKCTQVYSYLNYNEIDCHSCNLTDKITTKIRPFFWQAIYWIVINSYFRIGLPEFKHKTSYNLFCNKSTYIEEHLHYWINIWRRVKPPRKPKTQIDPRMQTHHHHCSSFCEPCPKLSFSRKFLQIRGSIIT